MAMQEETTTKQPRLSAHLGVNRRAARGAHRAPLRLLRRLPFRGRDGRRAAARHDALHLRHAACRRCRVSVPRRLRTRGARGQRRRLVGPPTAVVAAQRSAIRGRRAAAVTARPPIHPAWHLSRHSVGKAKGQSLPIIPPGRATPADTLAAAAYAARPTLQTLRSPQHSARLPEALQAPGQGGSCACDNRVWWATRRGPAGRRRRTAGGRRAPAGGCRAAPVPLRNLGRCAERARTARPDDPC